MFREIEEPFHINQEDQGLCQVEAIFLLREPALNVGVEALFEERVFNDEEIQ